MKQKGYKEMAIGIKSFSTQPRVETDETEAETVDHVADRSFSTQPRVETDETSSLL